MVASTRMVGRRAQEILSRDIMSAMARLNTRQTTGRSVAFSTTSSVLSQSRIMKRQKEMALSPKISSREQHLRKGGITSSQVPMFLPSTFILPFLSKLPREPSVLFPFLKDYIKSNITDLSSTVMCKFASMPSMFSRPIFKLRNSSVVATAKGLHRSMSEALASGDKDTIRKVCADRMADTLLATVDARPPGKRYAWELLKYNKKWRYPRIMSQKIAKIDKGKEAPMIRQVVVRICSRQRRVELDKQGQVVPGSEREVDLVENIALSTIVNSSTWKQDEWRIIGTAKDTTPEAWEEEAKLLKEVEMMEVAKHKI